MTNASTTFMRSCDHWSEKGRKEMEAFYALASVDYQHLAKAIDWQRWFEERQKLAGNRSLGLLDVACGSGKFPSALMTYGNLHAANIQSVRYSLLDPSNFSISETRRVLQPPFVVDQEFEKTLQELDCPDDAFDIVWATHALYAVPLEELQLALERFMCVIKKETGMGFIAHASCNSHYLTFYKHYLTGFRALQRKPYSSAEQIIALLDDMKVSFQVHNIIYTNGAPDAERPHVEGYLQRCVFDDTISLNDMLANSETGPYLKTCFHNDIWNFQQNVSLIFISA